MQGDGAEPEVTDPRAQRADVSSRILIAIRDYAAMKLGREVAYATFDSAVRDSEGGLTRATDPRGWVSLEVLHDVFTAFEDTLGPSFLADVLTWAIPARRDVSAMSLTALTTADAFYAHLDRARSYFARHVHFVSKRERPGCYAVQLHYREDVPKSRATCLVGQGVLLGVPLLFDLPPAKVAHHACRNDGAPFCSYTVEFRHEPPLALVGAGLGALASVGGALLAPSPAWLLALAGGWLVGREIQHARTRRFMTRVSEEHRRVLAEHEAEFQRRFDEIKALNDALERRRVREGSEAE
jgi:hypothetical protein